jgi:hypothetical protein
LKGMLFILLMIVPVKGWSGAFPITFNKGYIITEAIIEGQSVLVILDTGAPGLVLNQKYYESDPSSVVSCSGINGTFEAKTHQIGEWYWLGVTHKKSKALVSDLSFLERSLNKKIHALIGLSVLEDYYVSIDFEEEIISVANEMPVGLEGLFSRFQYVDHVPVISCKVNGAKKILGLDSGSAGNYLFDYDPTMDEELVVDATPIIVVGTDNIKDIKHQLTMELEVMDGDINLSSTFIVDLENKGNLQHAGFDGILGHMFLSNYKITIHPGKQRIWMQKRVEQPSFVFSLMP